MRSPTPFATWLETFLAPGRAPLLHLGRSPRRRRSLIAVRRWSQAYPFRAAPESYADTLDRLHTESANLSDLLWVFDSEVWFTLTAVSLEYVTTYLPLVPGDLILPVQSAQRPDTQSPTEIGSVAPGVALILYRLSSLGAPLRRFRKVNRIDQLAASVHRRLQSASPADLIAIHVMIRRLLLLRQERWARSALRLCLPLSPLTWLLEDPAELPDLAPYDWRGIERVLSGVGLDGLQTRCSQMFIEKMMPGWNWHAAKDSIREARFRRAADLFNRLAWVLDNVGLPTNLTFGPTQAMRLAVWILRTYRLMGRSLDTYQRIVLPPPVNPAAPDQIPSFRLLRQFFPINPEAIHENVAGLAAPIRPVLSLVLQASRITSTPIYLPDALPLVIPAVQPSERTDVGLTLAAQQLIAAWESLGEHPIALMGNLYQFVLKNAQQREGSIRIGHHSL